MMNKVTKAVASIVSVVLLVLVVGAAATEEQEFFRAEDFAGKVPYNTV